MATTIAGEQPDRPAQPKSSRAQLVVVDLGKSQSAKRIRRLRKGRGKLMEKVEVIVNDLVQAGTVSATAQPVVIVVRERADAFLPFMN